MRGVRRLPVDDPMNLLTRKPVDADSPVENSEEEPEVLSVESVGKNPELEEENIDSPAGLAEPVDTRPPTQKVQNETQEEANKTQNERQKMTHESQYEQDAPQRQAHKPDVTHPQQEAAQNASQPEHVPLPAPKSTVPNTGSARSKRSLADLCSQTNSAHKRYRVGLSRNVDPLHRKLHNSIN